MKMKTVLQGKKLIIEVQFDLVSSQIKWYIGHPETFLKNDNQFNELILDISKITDIDCNGILFIINIYKDVTGKGKKFHLIGVPQDIYQVFQLIHLNDILDIKSV